MEERRVVNDQAGLAAFFSRVYATMGGGLAVTALVSYLLGYVFQAQYLNFVGHYQIVMWIMIFLPFILTFVISGKRAQQNAGYATAMFLVLSAAYGFTFATILMVYPIGNVAIALITTAVVFFTMSLVGRVGHRDLTKVGTIAFAALIGIIILSLINMFIGSNGLQLLISYAILIVFIVLTASHTQALKRIYLTANSSGQQLISTNALAVQGALTLYLDFLNLFIAILEIFGGSSNSR